MPQYRHALPQLSGDLFLTDGGLETTLIFRDGWELPELAAFVLLETEVGKDALRGYYRDYAEIARVHGLGFVLESMTWRASRAWGNKLGYAPREIADFNRRAIELLQETREEHRARVPRMVISGCMGPRGDGYRPDTLMTPNEAAAYHREQIATLRETEADMVSAYTLPYAAEGAGVALAAQAEEMPAVISFTVETDGRLPSGESLEEAIDLVDAASNGWPAYYMINCAHPRHFVDVLDGRPWTRRIGAVRANASRKSHAELDGSDELDAGDPAELGACHAVLAARLPNLNVVGGCCGTDHRHVSEICRVLLDRSRQPEAGESTP